MGHSIHPYLRECQYYFNPIYCSVPIRIHVVAQLSLDILLHHYSGSQDNYNVDDDSSSLSTVSRSHTLGMKGRPYISLDN